MHRPVERRISSATRRQKEYPGRVGEVPQSLIISVNQKDRDPYYPKGPGPSQPMCWLQTVWFPGATTQSQTHCI